MTFKTRFRVLLAVQIGALLLTLMALAYAAVRTDLVVVPVLLGAVVMAQVFGLHRFFEANLEALDDFLTAVSLADYTQRFSREDIDEALNTAFNAILERLKDTRADQAAQAQYLDTLVKHVPVPLMAVRADGVVTLVNHPMRRLTGVAGLKRFDQLDELSPDLPRLLTQIPPGRRRLIQTRFRERPVELAVSVAEIRLGGAPERLYTLENLSGELTDREASAWRNLIRVLTHEIMNTLTPVTSLAHTAQTMLADGGHEADAIEAVATIARRSEGLMNFVAKYRELMRVPDPQFEEIEVQGMLEKLYPLSPSSAALTINVDPKSLKVYADPTLLDQVLLNLVQNAAEANAKHILLSGRLDRGHVVVKVEDDGDGIPEAVKEQLFVPFFTTKRHGSGIGLSISRQIMSAHGGAIAVDKPQGGGASFALIF